jgi:hypothetical protein
MAEQTAEDRRTNSFQMVRLLQQEARPIGGDANRVVAKYRARTGPCIILPSCVYAWIAYSQSGNVRNVRQNMREPSPLWPKPSGACPTTGGRCFANNQSIASALTAHAGRFAERPLLFLRLGLEGIASKERCPKAATPEVQCHFQWQTRVCN